MTYTYMGVSPESDANASVETGVYLRMGTYSDETGVTEYDEMPSTYKSAYAVDVADDHEGIFITSCGSYIVHNEGKAYIELQNGLDQKVTDGDVKTTVSDGDVNITTTTGGVSITGKSSYDIKSYGAFGIAFEAPDGKVSSSGKNIYKDTYGAYLKQVAANYEKNLESASYNISCSLLTGIYITIAFSHKLSSLSIKLADASAKVAKASGGAVSLGIGLAARAVIPNDIALALLYIKARGIQLETCVIDAKKEPMYRGKLGLVSLKTASAQAKTTALKAHIGLKSKMPGA